MKKFGLLLAGGLAAVVLLATVGPMIGMVISLAIMYFVFKKFMKSESTGSKIGWGFVGFIALMAAAHNAPAILGVVALYVLYIVYKKWNKSETPVKEESDPFMNFEKQWNELKQN